jgi:hypothetical protein
MAQEAASDTGHTNHASMDTAQDTANDNRLVVFSLHAKHEG